MSEYLIIVVCRGVYTKAKAWDTQYEYCDGALVREDDMFLLVKGEWGVTTMRWERGDQFPLEAFTLESELKASYFAESWTPHPWWCKPKRFEFVKVKPLLELRKTGYTYE